MTRKPLALTVALALAAVPLAACGSSSKPSYCDERSALKSQIEQIANTNVVAEGTNTLKSRVEGALTQVRKVSEAAKQDFPHESRDVEMALASVKSSLEALKTPDARRNALAVLPGQLSSLDDAARRLQTSIQQKCS